MYINSGVCAKAVCVCARVCWRGEPEKRIGWVLRSMSIWQMDVSFLFSSVVLRGCAAQSAKLSLRPLRALSFCARHATVARGLPPHSTASPFPPTPVQKKKSLYLLLFFSFCFKLLMSGFLDWLAARVKWIGYIHTQSWIYNSVFSQRYKYLMKSRVLKDPKAIIFSLPSFAH